MSDAMRIAVSVAAAVLVAVAGVLFAEAGGLEERWLVGGVAGVIGALVGTTVTRRRS